MTPDDLRLAQHIVAVNILVAMAAERLNITLDEAWQLPESEIMAVGQLLDDDVILAELEDGDQLMAAVRRTLTTRQQRCRIRRVFHIPACDSHAEAAWRARTTTQTLCGLTLVPARRIPPSPPVCGECRARQRDGVG